MTLNPRPTAERPLWTPSEQRIERANLHRFMRFVREETGSADINSFAPLYRFSIAQPERFWTLLWDFCGIRSSGDRSVVLADAESMAQARWFPNVRLNFAQNLLRFDDERIAIRFRNEAGDSQQISYAQLNRRVAELAAALKDQGVGLGDRVAGWLPNIPEAVIAMLASASLGAIWASCPIDAGSEEAVDRFRQIAPKILFTATGYLRDGERRECLGPVASALRQLPSIEHVVLVPYPDPLSSPLPLPLRDAASLESFVAAHADAAPQFVPAPFDHPLYILFSPRPAGAPDPIVHGAGGVLIEHLKELLLHADIKREDKVFCCTNGDSMMWNWLVSNLAVGATVLLYDGSPLHLDGNALWDLVDELGISVFGVSAPWLAATEDAGLRPKDSHKLLTLKTLLCVGPSLPAERFDYVYRDVKERVLLCAMSGGAETIGFFALGAPLLPVRRGELQCRSLGAKIEVLDSQGTPVTDEIGDLACTAPFPSMPIGLWNDADGGRFHSRYFSRNGNAWHHGERARLTEYGGMVF